MNPAHKEPQKTSELRSGAKKAQTGILQIHLKDQDLNAGGDATKFLENQICGRQKEPKLNSGTKESSRLSFKQCFPKSLISETPDPSKRGGKPPVMS